jgi:fido (protein-threonine AMPylation protein)
VSSYTTDSGYVLVAETENEEEKLFGWKAGIGLQRVDGLETTDALHELAEANIRGLKGYSEVESSIIENYLAKRLDDGDIRKDFEADLVAARIARLLTENDFVLSVATLKGIHRALFKGLEFIMPDVAPGEFKTKMWQKSEDVLGGFSVQYGAPGDVEENLREIMAAEREYRFDFPMNEPGVRHLAMLTSRIWEIHPFNEGNTRTTAVFIEKYLIKLGADINNDLFERHSRYFRDALVRSCYDNARLGVHRDTGYLEQFYGNALLGQENTLDPHDLMVAELCEQDQNNTTAITLEQAMRQAIGSAGGDIL